MLGIKKILQTYCRSMCFSKMYDSPNLWGGFVTVSGLGKLQSEAHLQDYCETGRNPLHTLCANPYPTSLLPLSTTALCPPPSPSTTHITPTAPSPPKSPKCRGKPIPWLHPKDFIEKGAHVVEIVTLEILLNSL